MVNYILIGLFVALFVGACFLIGLQGKEKEVRVFISIPITGLEKTVRQRLKKSIDYVENYADYLGGIYKYIYDPDLDRYNDDGEYTGLSSDVSYDEQLKSDIELMESCDLVVFTPGWRNSTGCQKEFDRASELGMPMFIINDFDRMF